MRPTSGAPGRSQVMCAVLPTPVVADDVAADREAGPAAGRSGLLSARLLRLAGDERLAALARAGNQAAFEAIYDRHHRPILSFCRHMLGNREDAEDAVQHTFLSAHTAMRRPTEHSNLRTWLFTIARNRCVDMLRARRDRDRDRDELIEPATEGLAAEVERRDDLRGVLADVQSLPEDQRTALLLSELRALPHAEIARVIGVPTPKVKALVFQARQSLLAARRVRETSCAEFREQLATLTGGALRRAPLRRHLEACPECWIYGEEMRRQRRALSIVLPVTPSLALKGNVLGGLIGGGGGGAALASGAAAGGLTQPAAAKLAAVVLLAGGGAAATVDVVRHPPGRHGAAPVSQIAPTPPRPTATNRPAHHPALPTASRAGSRSRPTTHNSAAPGPTGARPPSTTSASPGHSVPASTSSPRVPRSTSTSTSTSTVGSSPPASTSAGSHRSATGTAHAATPVRAGGRTDPGINARGRALGTTATGSPAAALHGSASSHGSAGGTPAGLAKPVTPAPHSGIP